MKDVKNVGYADPIHKRGEIEIIHKDKKGKVKNHLKIKNTITSAGLAESANLLIGAGTAFSYIALGIGTTAADVSQTQLVSEIVDTGLQRASATLSRVTTTYTNDTSKFIKIFTATGTKAVTEIGIFNASSAGVMLGRQTFGVITTANGDTLEMRYSIVNS